MELFLLLSALIASLTGTARQIAIPVQGVIQAQRQVAECADTLAVNARRALALARTIRSAPHPQGYVAPEVFAPHVAEIFGIAPAAPKRRRE